MFRWATGRRSRPVPGASRHCQRQAPIVLHTAGSNFEAAIAVPCLTATQATYTFTQPGKYLVICAFLPHFEGGMYAWVEVKEA